MPNRDAEIEAVNMDIRRAMKAEQEAFLSFCRARDVRRQAEEARLKLLAEARKDALPSGGEQQPPETT